MKDFAKSIVCNTKAEAEKVGNFEDPKKAKYYIEMWERRRDDAKRSLQNAEGHLKEAMKHRYGDKEFNQREVQRYQEAVKAAEASIKQYDDLIKSAAKTSFGNTRTGNAVPGTWVKKSAMDGPIQEKDFNGYSLVVQEDTDGKKKWWSWYVYKGNSEIAGGEESSEGSAKARAEHWLEHSVPMPTNRTGNSRVGNKKIKGSYVTIDTSTGRVTFDDFAGKSFDVSRIDSSAGYELRVMQQQINDFKKALEEAKSLAKQNGLI